MGDSDESWSGGEESVSSEEVVSSEPEASDTDARHRAQVNNTIMYCPPTIPENNEYTFKRRLRWSH